MNTTLKTPGPSGYPLVGVVPFMVRDGADYLRTMFAQYGDIVELKLLGPLRLYLFAHPDHVQHILQTKNQNYIVKRPSMHLTAMMGQGLTLSNGDLWLRQRRLMQPAFHRRKVEQMTETTARTISQMLDGWRDHLGQSFDLATEMEHLSLAVLLATLFGSGITESESQRIVQAVAFVLHVAGRGMFLEVPPAIPTPENLKVKQALRELHQVFEELIEQHRQNPDDERDDLISLLLEARDPETGAAMSQEQLRDEVTSILVAGYETTATALTWTFYQIAQQPEVERQLRQELDKVLGGRVPTMDDLMRLDYMRRVIEECMRLYPPFWGMTREVVNDDTIGGYRVPAGSLVVVSPYVTQIHPAFWDEPLRFDPERFTKEQSAGRHRFAYFPFGAGPRICIGEANARLAMGLTVAMTMQRYALQLDANHKVEIHTAMTMRPKYGMWMNLTARTVQEHQHA
jgi:cytochrome P450